MAKPSDRQMAAFKKLGYSDAQIEEMLEDDLAVDRGESLPWDMSKEEHKKPTVYKFDKRERKANPTKAAIIAEIAQFLIENSENACENVVITNKERQIAFQIGENSYEFTLVQKRKPKN